MDTIEPGERVLARTAFGNELPKVAVSRVVAGHDFEVVWVCQPDEWGEAQYQGRPPVADPWPAQDVRAATLST